MEIFIIGALVVALMVYVSTKIKKSAAQAYEPELVERDDFTIQKPEGFLSPLEARDGFLFEAYSRDYGEKTMRNTRQATALLTADSGLTLEAERQKAKDSAKEILSEKILKTGAKGEKTCLLEIEKRENGFPAIEFWKIVESAERQKTFSLQVWVLQPFRDVYIDKINELINSFRLK
jgi:hypothetical protein